MLFVVALCCWSETDGVWGKVRVLFELVKSISRSLEPMILTLFGKKFLGETYSTRRPRGHKSAI